jgi:tetratricopeptide (TPR) repeat protein
VKEAEKQLAENKTGVGGINKLLADAKVKEAGEKGVAAILAAKKDAEDKLAAVNKLLQSDMAKEEGAKGLAQLMAARDQLAKERDELDQAVKDAYKELAGGGLASPDDEPRAKLVQAVKNARLKAESPLTIPLTHLAGSMSGLGTGAGKLVQKGFDLAATGAEQGWSRLSKLLEERLSFQPLEPPPSNPALADQFYARGLDLYFARRYAEAETQFSQAIQNHSQDARYQYYLGLSLVNQGKRDAADAAFAEGAKLEAANRPSLGEINASLERIQGPLRSLVNSYRQKTRTAAY